PPVKRSAPDQAAYYRGIPFAPYDLVKELTIAVGAVLVLTLVLAATLSSPDVPPLTVQRWARQAPLDLVATATSELQGTSFSATYGPPYNGAADAVQALGPLAPQRWAGVHQPVRPAWSDVIYPLITASAGNRSLARALAAYRGAGRATQQRWLGRYAAALGHARVERGLVLAPAGRYDPLPVMMNALLAVARTGGLDALLTQSGQFYQTDYTGPLLFMGDGTYLAALAQRQHLAGDQWGMMNETGRYPGQAWLWLYSIWYQIPPYNTAPNADLLVVLTVGVLSTLLLLVPFIPGLRDLPRWIPVHRLIWREYYRARTPRR
ncbi:MAG TPA: cytochrome B6, partial [Candidatus Dormibacteraeota bacterium]|nr:cytochrome B6 [Candidatus Dormibacteraeota bacterium]